jgi:hypothetical protein
MAYIIAVPVRTLLTIISIKSKPINTECHHSGP